MSEKAAPTCQRCRRGFCCAHHYSERSGDETPVTIIDALRYMQSNVSGRIAHGFKLAQGRVV